MKNRMYFSELVINKIEEFSLRNDKFSAWDITQACRNACIADNSLELLDCPKFWDDEANTMLYNVQHDRVKALVHQFMTYVTNYEQIDTGKYIQYRPLSGLGATIDAALKINDAISSAALDWRDTKPKTPAYVFKGPAPTQTFNKPVVPTASLTPEDTVVGILKKAGLLY